MEQSYLSSAFVSWFGPIREAWRLVFGKAEPGGKV